MKTLVLELSSARGSIAWSDAAAEPFSIEFRNDRRHSGLFFENIKEALHRFGNPQRMVVGLGPGSYAGTRIAIAAATGLQAAVGAQLAGLPSLCAMETEASEYAVIGDARRDSYFFARVVARRCVEGPNLCTADEMVKRLATVTFPVLTTEPLMLFPDATVSFPSARVLAEIASSDAQTLTTSPLEPIYLREPHITESKRGLSSATK